MGIAFLEEHYGCEMYKISIRIIAIKELFKMMILLPARQFDEYEVGAF